MAKIIPNPALGEVTGTVGDLVFARLKTGKVVVRHRPLRKAARRARELVNQQQFTDSVAYAKRVWATQPDLKARYNAAALEKGRQGFQLAKADFRLSPKVQEIDLGAYTGNPGESIRISATDNFEVKGVEVTLRDLGGALIEQGAAARENGVWVYHAQKQVPAGQTVQVEATATDHPGHTGSKRIDHACGPRCA